jgi:Carbohydrate esterase, sialic acid-specific acetylesterase
MISPIDIDAIVFIGQSNMEQGATTNAQLTSWGQSHLLQHRGSRIWQKTNSTHVNDGFWAHLKAGVNNQINTAYLNAYGPELSLAYTLEKLGIVPYLIKFSLSGAPLSNIGSTLCFKKSAGELYPKMLFYIRTALEALVIKGRKRIRSFSIIIHHGEADSTDLSAANVYFDEMKLLLSDLQSDLSYLKIDIENGIKILVRPHNKFINPETTRPYIATMRQTYEDLVFGSVTRNRTPLKKAFLLDGDKLTIAADGTHLTDQDMLTIGVEEALVYAGKHTGILASERLYA